MAKERIDAKSWEAAEGYIRILMDGMRQLDGLPIALIVHRLEKGPIAMIGSDFPAFALPTIEEWMDMYPGRKEGRTFRLTVKPPGTQGQ